MDVLSQILKTASESEGFFYTILCEIKGVILTNYFPQVPVFWITGEKVYYLGSWIT